MSNQKNVTIIDRDNWPHAIASIDGNVYIECRKPSDATTPQQQWREALSSMVISLNRYQGFGVSGVRAVKAVLTDQPVIVARFSGIQSIAYAEPDSKGGVYTWPENNRASHKLEISKIEFPCVEWGT